MVQYEQLELMTILIIKKRWHRDCFIYQDNSWNNVDPDPS